MSSIDDDDEFERLINSFKNEIKEMKTSADPQLFNSIQSKDKYSKKREETLNPQDIDFGVPPDTMELELNQIFEYEKAQYLESIDDWLLEAYNEYSIAIKPAKTYNNDSEEHSYSGDIEMPFIDFESFKNSFIEMFGDGQTSKKKTKKVKSNNVEIPKEFSGFNFSKLKNSTKDFDLLDTNALSNNKVIIWSFHAQERLNERIRDGLEVDTFKVDVEKCVFDNVLKFNLGDKANATFRAADATNYKVGFVANKRTITIQTLFQYNKESKQEYKELLKKKNKR